MSDADNFLKLFENEPRAEVSIRFEQEVEVAP